MNFVETYYGLFKKDELGENVFIDVDTNNEMVLFEELDNYLSTSINYFTDKTIEEDEKLVEVQINVRALEPKEIEQLKELDMRRERIGTKLVELIENLNVDRLEELLNFIEEKEQC
jgi:hypothetical protein